MNKAKKVPKTIRMGLTKSTPDGKNISIHHPNPNGKLRSRKAYRSLKSERNKLLPNMYKPYDSNAQNGAWQCPVKNCGELYTRKAGVLDHLKKVSRTQYFWVLTNHEQSRGHFNDELRDDGDGWFTKIGGPSTLRRKNDFREQQWIIANQKLLREDCERRNLIPEVENQYQDKSLSPEDIGREAAEALLKAIL